MTRRLVLDSNLLVLLVTGLTAETYIQRNKRLATFDIADFRIVRDITEQAAALILSPNVLSETSNLLRYAWGTVALETSATLVKLVAHYGEHYVPCLDVADDLDFARIGLTDCVLKSQAATGAVLLTDDLDLYLASSKDGHDAVNYNYIRTQRPDYR